MSTATTQRSKKAAGRSGPITSSGRIVGAPDLPQVDLLPKVTREKRALQKIKLWLLAAVGLVLVLILLGYVASLLAATKAADALDTENTETQRLLTEQATYAEVPRVLGQIADAEQAEIVGMGNEILWAPYTLDVIQALPKGALLMSMSTTAATPVEAPPLPGEPLVPVGVGTVQLTHRSPTIPDTSKWIIELNDIPGFSGALFSVSTVSDEEGDVFYDVTTTVQVTEEAFSGRFNPVEEDSEAEDSSKEEVGA